MAERTRFAKSASPRELKRSYSAAVRTCAGTASSIAALIVQRPSPESETRPAKPERTESLARALAVTQWRRLGIDRVGLFADIGGAQYPQALGVGGHDAVLDAVVHHLDKMP